MRIFSRFCAILCKVIAWVAILELFPQNNEVLVNLHLWTMHLGNPAVYLPGAGHCGGRGQGRLPEGVWPGPGEGADQPAGTQAHGPHQYLHTRLLWHHQVTSPFDNLVNLITVFRISKIFYGSRSTDRILTLRIRILGSHYWWKVLIKTNKLYWWPNGKKYTYRYIRITIFNLLTWCSEEKAGARSRSVKILNGSGSESPKLTVVF